jgi:rod shape-determining protein MreC
MDKPGQTPLFVRRLGLKASLAIYLALGWALIAADIRYQALDTLRDGAAVIVHPLQAQLARPFLFFSEASEFFTVHRRLLEENRQLLDIQRRYAMTQQQSAAQAVENTRLRGLLALPAVAGFSPRAAEVVSALPGPFNRRLILDVGEEDGIQPGWPVIDVHGLAGQITRVHRTSSEMTLLTSPEQSVPVQVLRNGLRLIASGLGSDDMLEIRYLDTHADLVKDDVLVTSGLDGIYPGGIPVARVLRIEPPRHTPFARALCAPIGRVGHGRHFMILQPAP